MNSGVTSPDAEDFTTATRSPGFAATPTSPSDLLDPNTLSLNKFQQQLSGEWNTRVMRREKYSGAPSTTPFSPSSAALSWESESYPADDLFPRLDDDPDWPLPPPPPPPPPSAGYSGANVPGAPTATAQIDATAAVSFLQQLDSDYLALRKRMVDFLVSTGTDPSQVDLATMRLQQQQQQRTISSLIPNDLEFGAPLPTVMTMTKEGGYTDSPGSTVREVAETRQESPSPAQRNRTKYWPPLRRFKYDS